MMDAAPAPEVEVPGRNRAVALDEQSPETFSRSTPPNGDATFGIIPSVTSIVSA